MYEEYTTQALPSKRYRELLGSALCVFNSNNAFVIENILNNDSNSLYDWYMLIDKTSGALEPAINDTITQNSNSTIANMFADIVKQRNRIMHSFQITDSDGEQRLRTKNKDDGKQYTITEDTFLDFIKSNENLSAALHSFRGC